jgi:hypothetical protein
VRAVVEERECLIDAFSEQLGDKQRRYRR